MFIAIDSSSDLTSAERLQRSAEVFNMPTLQSINIRLLRSRSPIFDICAIVPGTDVIAERS